MAHNLEMINGQGQMVYVGETPWHGLGTLVPNGLTPIEMLDAAGLNWQVEKVPLFADLNGKRVQSNHSLLVRSSDNKILDEVTNDWFPVQNEEAFTFFDEFVRKGQMNMHTAGSLHGGRIVWALAKINESFEVVKGDVVESFMLFSNPHRFGRGGDIRHTPTRVVCDNTLSLALRTPSDIAVRFTHRVQFDADKVKEMLKQTREKLDVYKDAACFMASKQFDEDSLKEFVTTLFPLTTANDNTKKDISLAAKRIIDIIPQQPGANFAEGSFWSAFNAVTFYVDHRMGREQNNRVESAWFGAGKDIKNKALRLGVELAKAA